MANRPVRRHSVVIGPGWLALLGLIILVISFAALVTHYGWNAFWLGVGLPAGGAYIDRWARED